MGKKRILVFLIFLFAANFLFAGTTGKIAGTVRDGETGEVLPGVNISIMGTMMGAAADMNGYYVILGVPPGEYKLTASMMGYVNYMYTNVRAKIDITTVIDFQMKEAVLEGEEITVVAERPVVEPGVAASQLYVTSEHIEALPVASVAEVVGLQAGVTSGLYIRGSSSDQSIFMVDGIILRDERNNEPITAVPLSAVKEISVQTGGFSAEYNNVRSGVVNVVTREGEKNRYGGVFTFKARPPGPKYFGTSPYDPDSYWLRSYLDPNVCWTGTESGAWDKYQQRQYPKFDGWNIISDRRMKDDDPTNDITPAAAQRIFQWEHRKEGDIDKSDYNMDGGFGGPVPIIGESLGNLRFYTSFLKHRNMYLMELSCDAMTNESYMLRLTSDITPSIKLSLLGLYGETAGTNESRSGGTDMLSGTLDIADQVNQRGFTVPWRIYTNNYWSSTTRYYNTVSAKLRHVISAKTFYEAQIKRTAYKYFTTPGRNRDYSKQEELFDGYWVGEEPLGFQAQADFGITGLAFGGPISTARDYSRISSTSAKLDLVSQINPQNEIKAGAEIVFDDYDMSFGSINTFLPEGNTWTSFERNPFRLTAYLSDKLEYKGFVASLGLIAEYSNPNGDWYDIGIYDSDFLSQNYKEENETKTNKAASQLVVSPRLAISHPITEYSKLYFNYGHYRQMPTSERQFRIQRAGTNQMDYLGDPTIPLARTVAYELGYDHSLFDNYLFHLAAYYKDISDQEDWTRIVSFDYKKVIYRQLTANSYEDIRGFEADLTKLWGRWFIGNINYEYRVETSGYFGYGEIYENPAEQREYDRNNPQQYKPRPRPRFKSYLDFHTPGDYGTKWAGIHPLGEWHINLISRWTAGYWFEWNPQKKPGIDYNVQWNGDYSFDLKISKLIPLGNFNLKIFADFYNLFNLKQFSRNSFIDIHDYNDYMYSLHLAANITDELDYGNIPGDDRPGDVRKEGVEFVPIEWNADLDKVADPNSRAIYYDASNKKYMQYVSDTWVEVNSSRIDQVLDDKAYIDMPNQTFFTFLNPRSIFWGFTLNYNF